MLACATALKAGPVRRLEGSALKVVAQVRITFELEREIWTRPIRVSRV